MNQSWRGLLTSSNTLWRATRLTGTGSARGRGCARVLRNGRFGGGRAGRLLRPRPRGRRRLPRRRRRGAGRRRRLLHLRAVGGGASAPRGGGAATARVRRAQGDQEEQSASSFRCSRPLLVLIKSAPAGRLLRATTLPAGRRGHRAFASTCTGESGRNRQRNISAINAPLALADGKARRPCRRRSAPPDLEAPPHAASRQPALLH